MNLYNSLKRSHFRFINYFFGTRALPWSYYKILQLTQNILFKRKKNTLSPEESDLIQLFDNEKLDKEIASNIELSSDNQWTLDCQVLNYLWDELNKNKPKVIIEFGSGTSTKLLFSYIRRYPQFQFTLITIDQDIDYLNKTENESGNIPNNVNFYPLFSPLTEMGYKIDFKYLSEIIEVSGKIDMVLIDGPSGGWMIRENTLPSIITYCKNRCTWYLDDAFRDSEMEILKKWKDNTQIEVKGIVNMGKGLATGYTKRL